MKIFDLFERGGPIMYVIALASVVATAVFLERLWTVRRSRVVPRGLILEIGELIRADRTAEAMARCAASQTAAGTVFCAVLRRLGQPTPALQEAAQEVGRREAQRLERGVALLGTIASLGPLLGLLGTVLGMIQVFQKVAESGAGSPLEMAAGIWVALLTTAFGLLVAIPALVMHRFLLSRIDHLVLELEDEVVHLVETIAERKGESAVRLATEAA